MAMGVFVVPLLIEFQKDAMLGNREPTVTPSAITKNINNVKYRSKKLSFFITLVACSIDLSSHFYRNITINS